MYKLLRHINVLFVVGILFYYIYLSWPFVKLAGISFWNQLTPGAVVFNFLMEIVPPYRLSGVNYALGNSKKVVRYLSGESDVFNKYKTFLEIPKVAIKGYIVEGKDESAMDHGFWHYPGTGDIKYGGNIVIVGHRYLKLPPAKDTFFNLDKVSVGDKIFLTNRLGRWTFVVVYKKVVSVDAVEFLQNDKESRLTLITCHPVWTSKKRLVVIAKPLKNNNENIF